LCVLNLQQGTSKRKAEEEERRPARRRRLSVFRPVRPPSPGASAFYMQLQLPMPSTGPDQTKVIESLKNRKSYEWQDLLWS